MLYRSGGDFDDFVPLPMEPDTIRWMFDTYGTPKQ